MNAPRLSVVVPTRDTRALTLRCLGTVQAAAVPGLEIVVVDDRGSDGTAEAVRDGFPIARVFRRSRPGGFSRAANEGVSVARGDVVLVLNSDTEVAVDALHAVLAAFDRDATLGIAGASLRFPDGRAQWSGGPLPDVAWLLAVSSGLGAAVSLAHRRLRRPRTTVQWVSGAALAVRRAVWDAIGPFDTRFRFYCQDLDLCVRAGDAGWRIAVLPEAHVVHHGGATIARGRTVPTAGYVPELLWPDLVRWAEKRAGVVAARRARRMLLLGGTLRIAARALVQPLVTAGRRAAWERDTRAFVRAVRRVQATAV